MALWSLDECIGPDSRVSRCTSPPPLPCRTAQTRIEIQDPVPARKPTPLVAGSSLSIFCTYSSRDREIVPICALAANHLKWTTANRIMHHTLIRLSYGVAEEFRHCLVYKSVGLVFPVSMQTSFEVVLICSTALCRGRCDYPAGSPRHGINMNPQLEAVTPNAGEDPNDSGREVVGDKAAGSTVGSTGRLGW